MFALFYCLLRGLYIVCLFWVWWLVFVGGFGRLGALGVGVTLGV